MNFTVQDIINFAKNSIEQRELFKYEFTKSVSFIIELLKKVAGEMGIGFSEFAYLI